MKSYRKIEIKVKGAGVCYRRKNGLLSNHDYWALEDISFELYRGETLGVIGRNGVGKSTLLRLLAGIIDPDKGEITRDCGMASLLTLQLGFVAHLTGRENAILSGILMGMRRREVKKKINQIIEFSGVGDFIDQPVGTYSSGMRARLGFAVACYASPDILLIDEVLGVGDAEFKKKSSSLVRERMKSDQTAVLVSHNANLVRELCDRVIWIEKGKMIAEGGTYDIITEYQKSFSS